MSKTTTMVLQDCFALRARIGWQGLRADEFQDYGPYLVTGTDFINGKVNWDTCYHVTDERFEQDKGIQLRENDLLVTKDGTVGKTAFVVNCPEKTTLNSHIFLVRATTGKVLPQYLYYILNSRFFEDFQANTLTGTTIKGLTQENFYKFSFPAPTDTKEQAKIAEVLATVDEAIDETRRIIQKYRNIQTGMLEDFTSYGLHINDDHSGADISPERFVGLVPDNWVTDTLKAVTSKIADRDHTTPVYVSQGVLIVSPKDFDEDQYIDFERCERISLEAHLINRKKTDITAGDLIFTRIGAALGKVCYVEDDMPEFSILHSAAMIRTNDKILSRFLMYSIRASYFQRQIEDGKQSIGVPDLGMDKINSLIVKYPISKDEQQLIVDALDAIESKIMNERRHFKKLLKIKQGLMQDLLTQKVSVEPIM